jgi:hypothetical protein
VRHGLPEVAARGRWLVVGADRPMNSDQAPEGHVCKVHGVRAPLGSVWRCNTCGTYWRLAYWRLFRPGGWWPLRGVALRWWKRRHRDITG